MEREGIRSKRDVEVEKAKRGVLRERREREGVNKGVRGLDEVGKWGGRIATEWRALGQVKCQDKKVYCPVLCCDLCTFARRREGKERGRGG